MHTRGLQTRCSRHAACCCRCHPNPPNPTLGRQTYFLLCAAASDELHGPAGMTGKAVFIARAVTEQEGQQGWGTGARELHGFCGGQGAGRCYARQGHTSSSVGGTTGTQPRHFEAHRKQGRRETCFLRQCPVKLNSLHLKQVCPQATANDLHFCAWPLKQAQNISTRNMKWFVVASGAGWDEVQVG